MAKRIGDEQVEQVWFGEGYRGKPLRPGAKVNPPRVAAADVPSEQAEPADPAQSK